MCSLGQAFLSKMPYWQMNSTPTNKVCLWTLAQPDGELVKYFHAFEIQLAIMDKFWHVSGDGIQSLCLLWNVVPNCLEMLSVDLKKKKRKPGSQLSGKLSEKCRYAAPSLGSFQSCRVQHAFVHKRMRLNTSKSHGYFKPPLLRLPLVEETI